MAVAFINARAAVSTDTFSAMTAAIDTSGATLAIICVYYYDAVFGTITASQVSDSASNSYTAIGNYVGSGTAANSAIRMFYKANPTTAANHTATVSTGGTAIYPGISFAVFSGVFSPPFDVQNGFGAAATGGTTIQPGSITPSGNNYLIVTGVSMAASSSGIGIDSGFSLAAGGTVSGSAGFGFGGSLGYLIQGSAAAVNPQWSATSPDFRASDISSWVPIQSSVTTHNLANLGAGR